MNKQYNVVRVDKTRKGCYEMASLYTEYSNSNKFNSI